MFLGAAFGLHVLALSFSSVPSGTAGAAGDSGTERVSLAASTASLTALVQQWDRPPEVTPAAMERLQAPSSDGSMPQLSDAAAPARPTGSSTAPPMPRSATAPRLDMSPPAPKPAPEPATKPKTKTKPKSKSSTSSAGQKAAGQGNTGLAGQRAKSNDASLSQAQTRRLTAKWAGQIVTRIERKKRYPSAARGRDGVVGLRLTLGRNGNLQAATITQSAGHSALDRAALSAVKRVGRFPAAPKGLAGARFSFNLKIRFDG